MSSVDTKARRFLLLGAIANERDRLHALRDTSPTTDERLHLLRRRLDAVADHYATSPDGPLTSQLLQLAADTFDFLDHLAAEDAR